MIARRGDFCWIEKKGAYSICLLIFYNKCVEKDAIRDVIKCEGRKSAAGLRVGRKKLIKK